MSFPARTEPPRCPAPRTSGNELEKTLEAECGGLSSVLSGNYITFSEFLFSFYVASWPEKFPRSTAFHVNRACWSLTTCQEQAGACHGYSRTGDRPLSSVPPVWGLNLLLSSFRPPRPILSLSSHFSLSAPSSFLTFEEAQKSNQVQKCAIYGAQESQVGSHD